MKLNRITGAIFARICNSKIKWLLLLCFMLTISDGDSRNSVPCICKPLKHPKALHTAPQLIHEMGYNVEVHTVTTRDGYILEMHRIPPTNNSNHQNISSNPHASEREFIGNLCKGKGMHVAFLMHGLLSSSADFIMNDPDQALAYMMADAGWDVWLGNSRGNTYSRKHKILDPDKDSKFWDFSWDTVARFDLPAMLGYVRHHTGVSKLDYVGHSQGARSFFAMMHFHPYLKSWINLMVSFAGGSYVNHVDKVSRIPLQLITLFENKITKVIVGEILESSLTANKCPVTNSKNLICESDIVLLVNSWRAVNADPEFRPIIDAHNPAGSSLNSVNHLGQLFKSHGFKAYDYGRERNLLEYGTVDAPNIDLQNCQVPVALYWCDADTYVRPEDVKRLASELPNVIVNHQVKYEEFGHMDFVWSDKATYLYYHLMRTFLDNSMPCPIEKKKEKEKKKKRKRKRNRKREKEEKEERQNGQERKRDRENKRGKGRGRER